MKSFARTQTLSLGYDPRNLLTARMDLAYARYNSPAEDHDFSEAVLRKVRALPGVTSASIGTNPPQLGGWQNNFFKEGIGTPSTSAAAERRQRSGRARLLRDDADPDHPRPRARRAATLQTAPPAVVDRPGRGGANFPGTGSVRQKDLLRPGRERRREPLVPDRRRGGARALPRVRRSDDVAGALISRRHKSTAPTRCCSCARPSAAPRWKSRSARSSPRSIPTQPVFDVRTMMDRLGETWAAPRLLTILLGIFAGLALLLATIGLYGVISFNVLRRRREIGVRLAVGAQRSDIGKLILGQGGRLLAAGLTIGSDRRASFFAAAPQRALRGERDRPADLPRREPAARPRRSARLLASRPPRRANRPNDHASRRITRLTNYD